jgi:hypothetical protein
MDLEQYVNDLLFIKKEPKLFGAIKEATVNEELDRTRGLLAYVQKKIKENTPDWSRVCPTLPALPERTEEVSVVVNRCGWNPVTFLPSNSAGWSITRLGAWCPGKDPDWLRACEGGAYKPAGDSDNFRCVEGNQELKVQEDNVAGPCHVESLLGDNICEDNVDKEKNPMRAEFTANLPRLVVAAYRTALDAKLPTR